MIEMISGKTHVLGIFGDPVEHSFSPKMQNAALTAAGIDAIYLPFHVLPEQLESAVEAIRALSLVGVNVTVPHKERILSFLDEVDDLAAMIGAVNTVVNQQGHLIGFNTDAHGFLTSLRDDLRFDPDGKRVVILGAGGACRAALVALAGEGVSDIVVANRNEEKSDSLARVMQAHFPGVAFSATGLTESGLSGRLSCADLLVNTTSVGLRGDVFPEFIVSSLAEGAVVYDMVYVENSTPLIKSVSQRDLACVDGRGMLVAQGEAAFLKWFGVHPQAGVMRSQVIEK